MTPPQSASVDRYKKRTWKKLLQVRLFASLAVALPGVLTFYLGVRLADSAPGSNRAGYSSSTDRTLDTSWSRSKGFSMKFTSAETIPFLPRMSSAYPDI
jgi:hypothetical protein